MKKNKKPLSKAIKDFRDGEAKFHNERVTVNPIANPRIVALEQQAKNIADRAKKEGVNG